MATGIGKLPRSRRPPVSRWQAPPRVSHPIVFGYFVERDIFIDNVDEVADISDWVTKGVQTARRRGSAVLIGHVTSENTPLVLDDLREDIVAGGLAFVRLSDILLSPRVVDDAGTGD